MTNRFARLGLRAVVWCALAASSAGQTTTRVSVTSSGAEGNGDSRRACISADGTIVVFQSIASNIVPGDTNGDYDVFVHDRASGVTRLVSVSSNGSQGNSRSWYPTISGNGRFVAFESFATNLVDGDTNGHCDIFVHDLETGQTRRASVNSSGAQANGPTYHAFLSGDGRYVSFWGFASNLVPGDTNGTDDGFVHDMLAGETVRVSVSTAGIQSNGRTTITKISHSGRIVVFMSRGSNLVPPDTNPEPDIFVRDLDTGVTELISVSTTGVQANNDCYDGSISGDGRVVSFTCLADNLVPDDVNGERDVYARDRVTGVTERVSVNSDGDGANAEANSGTLSYDGRFIAFQSFATNLVPDDTNACVDVFMRDRLAGTTIRVSVDSSGAQGDGDSLYPAAAGISADGSFVAFDSLATNLAPGDDNGVSDAFIHYLPPILPPLPFSADAQPAAIAIANFDVDLDVFKRPDLAVVNAASNSVSLLDNNGVVGQLPSFAPPSPERTFAVGAGPTAAVAGNLDDNPYPDLVVANTFGGTVSVLLGSPIAGFVAGPTLPAPGAPRALSLADLDRDGWQDVLVARRDADAISIFRNLGGGKFAGDQPQNVPPGGRPNGVGSGDLDNDKDVDPVITITNSGHVAVHLNISPGPGVIALAPAQLFSVGTGDPRPVSVVLKDFDFDGFLDVACANKGVGTVAVLRNLGLDTGGAWLGLAEPVSFPVGELPVSVGADNVYGFGFPDLFTANAFVDASNESSVSLLKNVSSGPGDIAFEPEVRVGVPPLAAHVAAADVNLDNRLDLAVATGFDAGSLGDSARGASPGVAAVLAGASPSVALAPCDGDANGDRFVDFVDLNFVLGFYGQNGPALPGDLNADGVVDFLDLNIVLSAFGAAC